jgi:hypothetical protein
MQEISIHSSVHDHPNVLKVLGVTQGTLPLPAPYGLGQGDQDVGLILEVANGGSLQDLVNECR